MISDETAAGECREPSGRAGKLEQKIWPNHTRRHTNKKIKKPSAPALCTGLEVKGEAEDAGSSQSAEADLRYSSLWNDRLESMTTV